jgi:hypothetical protein
MQIYWDRIAIVDAEPQSAVQQAGIRRRELTLTAATAADVGFSTRKLYDNRLSIYDYDRRPPLADTRHPAGFYSEFGDVLELVAATDDAVAIIGPGEEVQLEFSVPTHKLQLDWHRCFVLEADGWCKDADLFTKTSGTVEPLPVRATVLTPEQSRRREYLHRKYNTRFCSG